nr:biotin/lipoyl-binding protein [Azospirillum sp. INR13]
MEQSAVKAEVAARLAEVPVREGQAIRRGEVLARFETVELTARLNEKQANLEGARAQLVLAEKTLAKNRTLNRNNIVSDTSLDQAESSFGFQRAQVDALAAQVSWRARPCATRWWSARSTGWSPPARSIQERIWR